MKLLDIKTLKKQYFSEFQAAKWIVDHKAELVTTRTSFELARTRTDILYRPNKKEKFKRTILERRLATLLAKHHKKFAMWNKEAHTITIDNTTYKVADRVQSGEELAFHSRLGHPISLTQTTLCPQFFLDTETIKNHYLSFLFPKWFIPYTKQRHFKYAMIDAGFKFQSRAYNDAPHKPAHQRMRTDIARHAGKIAKAYFSLNRMLDPVRERHGTGHPLGLFYLAFDIDSEDHPLCHISPNGLCKDCMESSTEKLEKFKTIIETLPGFRIENVLFSGTKGWHVHCSYNDSRELPEKEFIMLNHYILTQDPKVIDNFIIAGKGKPHYDRHRVLRVPGSIDATTSYLISEDLERLPVQDYIERF